jgi:hypothetical protein
LISRRGIQFGLLLSGCVLRPRGRRQTRSAGYGCEGDMGSKLGKRRTDHAGFLPFSTVLSRLRSKLRKAAIDPA